MKRLADYKLIIAVLCVLIVTVPIVAFVNTIESGKHMVKSIQHNSSLLLDITIGHSGAKYEDFEELSKVMPEITSIIPIYASNSTISSYRKSSAVTLKAVGSEFYEYAALKVTKGKFFDSRHIENNYNVIVIDDITADELFGTTDVIGRKLEIPMEGINIEAEIIGVCKRMDASEAVINNDAAFVYVPFTMMINNMQQSELQRALIIISDIKLEEARVKIAHFLNSRDALVNIDDISQRSQVELIDAVQRKYTDVLLVVSAILLPVAVIALTSLLLLDIEENKKLYGLMKFYGSTRRSIKSQIFGKAYSMSLLCSALSILLGIAASFAVCYVINIPFYISVHSVTTGIILPVMMYIAAAIFPAHKAFHIDVNKAIWQIE